MPNARATGHRIRSGTHTSANITSGYAVTSLATQSDMTSGVEWYAPMRDGTSIPRRARIVTAADGTQVADGFYVFEWRFSYFTFGMLSHWFTSFLPSSAESALVSVMAYDDTDTAIYLNCTLLRSHFPGDGRAVTGG